MENSPEPSSRRGLIACIQRGVMGTCSTLCNLTGLHRLTITQVNSISYLTPIVSLLLGALFNQERLQTLDVFICFSAFMGSLLVIKPPLLVNIFLPTPVESFQPSKIIGMLAICGTVLFYASSLNIIRKI